MRRHPSLSDWEIALERRRRRHLLTGDAATWVAVTIALIVLASQFAFGGLRDVRHASLYSMIAAGSAALWVVATLTAPAPVLRAARRALHLTSYPLIVGVVSVLMLAVYIAAWPVARTFGRRGYLRRHPASRPWVTGGPWQVPTFVAKSSAADRPTTARRVRRPVVWRAAAAFVAQRNFVGLAVAVLLLLIAAVLGFATSPVVAPFIYTLF
jgi:hypothetical protein